jgi:6,7-dimethyl-8-ribityllumazine synthase
MERPRILIVEARFYEDIADELKRGAAAALEREGADHESIAVPGAFEIPTAVHMAHRAALEGKLTPRYDGYVALGCVIRGETSHYDYVCGESARKLQDLACDHQLALGYGIITCESRDQAWARAAVEQKDKGGAAARACLRMLGLRHAFGLVRAD